MSGRSVFRAYTIAMAFLVSASCGAGPTADDINNSLENTLQSVNGPWTGIIGSNQATLAFTLTQNGSTVTGNGTMKEASAPSSVPITITGTFNRPSLSLTFNGMVFEGTNVQGTAQGSYTSVGGVGTQIRLVGTNYDKIFSVLLAEQ